MIDPRLMVRAVVFGSVLGSAGLLAQSVSVESIGGMAAKAQPMGRMTAPAAPYSSAGRSSLPLHQIALYKNGVAFFERSGFVTGDALIHIDFTSAQLNDVLQSLTATDLGGGHIAGVGYDNNETLGQQLDQLHLGLGPDPTVMDFLNAIKGRQVEVHGGPSVITGKLLNVEVRPVTNPRNGERSEKRFVSVVTAGGGLRTIELTPLVEVRMTETDERVEIGRYLKILATTHDPPMRHLTLEARGIGRREIRIGYLGQTAAWKSNYRLLVTNGAAAKTATLQGFAVIDNTTDADWENVQLTLISGAQQGFKRGQSGGPEDGWSNITKQSVKIQGGVQIAAAQAAAPPAGSYQEAAKNSLGVDVTSRSLDDLFEYKLAAPASIKHGESAMLPILQTPIEAERVSVWFSREQGKGVQRALWIGNTTGLTLDKGNVTLLEDGTFAGQGEIPLMAPASRRIVAYSADDAVKVSGKEMKDPPSEVRHIEVKDGVLTEHHEQFKAHTYTIENGSASARTVVLGVRESAPQKVGRWQLSKKTPADETVEEPNSNLYRFSVTVDPRSTKTFTMLEWHSHPTHEPLDRMKSDDLASVIRDSHNNPDVTAKLQPILDGKKKLEDLNAQLRDQQKAIDEVNAEESRLRQNIATLKGSAEEKPLTKRYSDAMLAQEDKLAALQNQRDAARQQKVATEKMITDQIHGLVTDIKLPDTPTPGF